MRLKWWTYGKASNAHAAEQHVTKVSLFFVVFNKTYLLSTRVLGARRDIHAVQVWSWDGAFEGMCVETASMTSQAVGKPMTDTEMKQFYKQHTTLLRW